jgi:hypothetical protein
MTRRRISRGIGLIVLLVAMISMASCDKREPVKEPTQSPEQKQAPKIVIVKNEENFVAEEIVSVPAGMEALPIVLPNAMFVGTPKPINVPNLEQPRGRARPPFYAPRGTIQISKGKPVTGSDNDPILGELEIITDGDKEAVDGSYVELGPFRQFVTVDLESDYEIYAVLVWHFHKEARVYFDVIGQVSTDRDFIDARTIFNNDLDNTSGMGVGKDPHYVETSEGRLIDAKGIKGRFVRFYSNGNNNNDLNHYIEIEVWGKPLKQ